MDYRKLTTTHRHPAGPASSRLFVGGTAECDALAAALADEMAAAWDGGERLRAEHFLDRFPYLWKAPAAVMDLLYEEICLRHQHGEPVDRDELLARFPSWRPQIEILLTCASALEPDVAETFPRTGETIGDFRLLAELGRGGQGRVFVASQSSLGDRPVVVKITPCSGDEHLSLARLQHSHIVPLLSVTEDRARDLRILCMPYFGGTTLASLLDGLVNQPVPERNGRQLLERLDTANATAEVPFPREHEPAETFLQRASYAQAICWIGASLAEALKYAHDRGLVHLDVKPSNILLTADRQPMLLDFHLAHAPLKPGDALVRFGGTPAYMSPEQKQAMNALKAGGVITIAVDSRSDIYSLALVLYEALGGSMPDMSASVSTLKPLHRCNPHVSRGLSDILGKCLSTAPADRYADAVTLATDLWRHLNDLPLHGVNNRSVRERWRKWRRRRPHLLSFFGMLAATLLVTAGALSLLWWQFGQRAAAAQAALGEGQKHADVRRYDEAEIALRRGIKLLQDVPGYAGLKQELATEMRLAKRGKLACELHLLADRFRFLYDLDGVAPAKLRSIEDHCRTFWDKRELILDKRAARLRPEIEERVATDLLDLAIVGSHLRVRLAGNRSQTPRHQALQMLAEAENLAGPSAVLYHERRLHADALGLADTASVARRLGDACPPRTAWEHDALGRSLLRNNDIEAAGAQFERALHLQPQALWPNFHHGICCYRLHRFEDAILAFTACTTLAPDAPACYVNRGLAFAAASRSDRALRDFDRALELDAACAEALLQRGILSLHEGKLSHAAADLQRALESYADPARAHLHLARVRLGQQDRAAAITHLELSHAADPKHADAAQLLQALRQQR